MEPETGSAASAREPAREARSRAARGGSRDELAAPAGGQARREPSAADRTAQALSDRSRSGSFVYLALALVVAVGTGYRTEHRALALALVAASALLGVAQFLLARGFEALYAAHPARWSALFSGVAYSFGALWGGFAAHTVVYLPNDRTLTLVLILVAGVVAGATTTLAPDRRRHVIYTGLMLGPGAVAAVWRGGPGSIALAVSIALYVAFTLVQGTLQYTAFQAALTTEMQLELKQLELDDALRKARVAADAKGIFLANMSHELRTPMHAVIGMAEVARLDPDLPEAVRDALGTVTDAAGDMVALLEELLLHAEAEEGLSLAAAPFSPREALADAVRAPEAAAQQKRLAFRAEVTADVPASVVGDRARFHQLVSFLADNAVKFTEHGRVAVTFARLSPLAQAGGAVRYALRVEDTGIGIAPGDVSRIFEPFQQADEGLSRRYTGAGLGLTLALELACAMGGGIEVVSSAGQGARFTATISLATA